MAQYLKPDGTFKWTRMGHPLTGSMLFCMTDYETYSIVKIPSGYRLKAYPSEYVRDFKTQREAKNGAMRHFIRILDEMMEA